MGMTRKLNIVVDAEYNGGQEIKAGADSVERLGLESEITAQKQAKFADKQKELAKAVSLGEKSFDDAERELKQYGDELERGISSSDKAVTSFESIAKTGAAVGLALGGVALAAQKTWDAFNEGAELISTEQKFYALAGSIGASDSALSNLRASTGNMVSDAKLMAGASELISYGIAKNEEEMVGWSNVVGKLNLDMQVLGLTLANNSKARLDSLGLSLEDVNKRTADFVKAGKSADEAFDLAVYDALNARVDLIGESLTGASMDAKVFAAEMENIKDEAKRATAEGLGPMVASLSANIRHHNLANDAIKRGIITQAEYYDIMNSGTGIMDYNTTVLENLESVIRQNERGWSDAEQTIIAYYQGMQTSTDTTLSGVAGLETYTNALISAGLQEEAFTASQEAGREARASATESYNELISFLGTLDGTAATTTERMQALTTSLFEQAAAAQVAAGNMTPLEAAISSINQQEGMGLISGAQADEMRDAAIEFENYNQIVRDNAAAFAEAGGATVEQGQLMADKLDLISTTSISAGDEMRLAATTGSEAFQSLGGDFDTTYGNLIEITDEVTKLETNLGKLVQSTYVVKVRYETEGASPKGPPSNTTAVANEIARD